MIKRVILSLIAAEGLHMVYTFFVALRATFMAQLGAQQIADSSFMYVFATWLPRLSTGMGIMLALIGIFLLLVIWDKQITTIKERIDNA